MNLNEFKHALIRPMVMAGIKTLPSDLETQLLYEQIQKYFKFISLSDFYLAFELNSLGQLWPRVEHFNLFNIAFLSDVLNKYKESQGKAINQAKKLETQTRIAEPVGEDIPEVERRAIIKDIIAADYVRIAENNQHSLVTTLSLVMINKLYEFKAVTDSTWTDSDWTRCHAIAKDRARRDALSNGYYFTDKARYRDNRRLELCRLLYLDLLTNKAKYKEVITKL